MMLTSTVMKLTPHEDCLLDPTLGRHAHALFLDLVQRVAPDLAGRLHERAIHKPFTVSPLQGKFVRVERPNGVKVQLTAGETYWMRFTTLSQEVFQPFLAAFLEPTTGFSLRLQDAVFTVTELITTPCPETPWSRYTDWDKLVAKAKPHPFVTVRFFSPTTFRQGKVNVAEPRPDLVFGSWWDKWNAFSPLMRLPVDREERNETLKQVVIARLQRLKTSMLDFGRFQQVGFIGTVTYDLSRMPEEQRWWLNVLALFAFYSGTGAKTAMGMGQTRRLKRGD